MATVKIRVPIEVEVDVEGWAEEYQHRESTGTIRLVVKNMLLTVAQDSMAHLDCVKVKPGW